MSGTIEMIRAFNDPSPQNVHHRFYRCPRLLHPIDQGITVVVQLLGVNKLHHQFGRLGKPLHFPWATQTPTECFNVPDCTTKFRC